MNKHILGDLLYVTFPIRNTIFVIPESVILFVDTVIILMMINVNIYDCLAADEVFCEMVKSNRLCEKKLYRQFCCRTCLMNG